jgi:hypothetical protein
MFRGFREIRVKPEEKNLTKSQVNEEIDITKRIKPENMTVNEAQAFWNNVFDNMSKEQ